MFIYVHLCVVHVGGGVDKWVCHLVDVVAMLTVLDSAEN